MIIQSRNYGKSECSRQDVDTQSEFENKRKQEAAAASAAGEDDDDDDDEVLAKRCQSLGRQDDQEPGQRVSGGGEEVAEEGRRV
jgi:hypothetical protein